MTDDELLEAIVADPDDDEPRLVYADRLCSRGDPRGEFIHVQVRLHRLRNDDPDWISLARRERELLAAHHATWLAPLGESFEGTLRRGFIDEISGRPEDLADEAPELVAREPVRSVTARVTSPEDVERVTGNPALRRIRRLAVHDRYEVWEEPSQLDYSIASIATSPVLTALTEVEIYGVYFADSGFSALVNSARFDQIQHFGLLRCGIDASHISAIARRNPAKLSRLELPSNRRIGTTKWQPLTQLESLSDTRIRALDLSHAGLTDGEVALLVDKLPPLEELVLGDGGIGTPGIAALASASALAGLRHLDSSGISLDAAAIDALAQAFPSLESLGVSCAASSIPMLAKARWPALRCLELNGGYARELSAVAAAFERLTVLHLGSADYNTIESIAAASWPHLHTVILAGSRYVNDRGALLLAEAAGLRSDLALLDVRYTEISQRGLAALRDRFGPAVAFGDDDDIRSPQWR